MDLKIQTLTLTYDKLGQRNTMTVPDGGAVTYTHDSVRQLTELENQHAEVTGFDYDDAGRKTQSEQANGTKASMVYLCKGSAGNYFSDCEISGCRPVFLCV